MHKVRTMTMSSLAAVSAVSGLLVVAGPATPAAAACSYTVSHNPSGIHENPSVNSVIRDYKAAFRTLSGPCRTATDASGVKFVAVYDGYCTDGLGWIRRSFLF